MKGFWLWNLHSLQGKLLSGQAKSSPASHRGAQACSTLTFYLAVLTHRPLPYSRKTLNTTNSPSASLTPTPLGFCLRNFTSGMNAGWHGTTSTWIRRLAVLDATPQETSNGEDSWEDRPEPSATETAPPPPSPAATAQRGPSVPPSGLYCCGLPLSRAIKEGEVDLNFDTAFAFSTC